MQTLSLRKHVLAIESLVNIYKCASVDDTLKVRSVFALVDGSFNLYKPLVMDIIESGGKAFPLLTYLSLPKKPLYPALLVAWSGDVAIEVSPIGVQHNGIQVIFPDTYLERVSDLYATILSADFEPGRWVGGVA